MRNTREEELYPIVANYFRRKGYYVTTRAVFPALIKPDVVALKPSKEDDKSIVYDSRSEIISVEVKRRKGRVRKAVYQATLYSAFSEYVYIAVPFNCVTKHLDYAVRKHGIGLLVISGDSVNEAIEPLRNEVDRESKRAVMKKLHLWGNLIIHFKEG